MRVLTRTVYVLLVFVLANPLLASAQKPLPVTPRPAPAPPEPAPPQPGLQTLQRPPQGQQAVSVGSDGRALTFKPTLAYEYLTLRVEAPDGRQFDVRGMGETVTFDPFATKGLTAADGIYRWEIRLLPRGAISDDVRNRARKARDTGDTEAERAHRLALARAEIAQSGAFTITGGKVVAGQQAEPSDKRRKPAGALGAAPFASINFATARMSAAPAAVLDTVIPDDLIVQGSACVGFDCVNNENFGFDTIKLKENNLRIKFEDTSVSPFPTTDWQLTANDSASGGRSMFSIDDVTGGRTPFTVEAGAITNAVYVDSTSDVGFKTALPVLDLHVNVSDTPGMRYEQNNSGGFSAQTWDVAANEANFFVRDVTSGSRLPFRIRPGAPTNSLFVDFNGFVGIGTSSPDTKLHVFGTETQDAFVGLGPGPDGSDPNLSALNVGYAGSSIGQGAAFLNVRPDAQAVAPNPSIRFMTANQERMIITNTGQIGIGVVPTNPISTATGAFLSAGGAWTNASSRAAKNNIAPLSLSAARSVVAQLTPVTFSYRLSPSEQNVGFIAEDVPDLVATPDRTGLSAMDIVAVLTRVVQDQQQVLEAQQKAIAELAAKIAALEAARQQ